MGGHPPAQDLYVCVYVGVEERTATHMEVVAAVSRRPSISSGSLVDRAHDDMSASFSSFHFLY